MRLLDLIEPPAPILRRIAERIERVADEGPVGIAVGLADLGHDDDLVDDAGELVTGLRALDLGGEDTAIEVVELLVEDADEPDVLIARALEVGEPGDHLLAV